MIFHRNADGSYSAAANDRRYVITRSGSEWRYAIERKADAGYVECQGGYAPTLTDAKGICDTHYYEPRRGGD